MRQRARFCVAACFNPHPPRRVGATRGHHQQMGTPSSFNPHPPRRVGATVSGWSRWTIWKGFNPHPPRRVGATFLKRTRLVTMQFQSSPTPKGGRYVGVMAVRGGNKCFNPHPPRRVGATSGGRATGTSSTGFNPHPPRRVGATASWLFI